MNLLVIDDDEVELLALQRARTKAGIGGNVATAANGEEGLKLLRSGSVPLAELVLIIDINMPRMTGLEFLRALRADKALCTLPVIVFSSSSDPKDIRAAYEAHCAGYVVKPLSHTQYVDSLRSIASYWNGMAFPS